MQLIAAHEVESVVDRPLASIVRPLLATDDVPTTEIAQPRVVSHYELLEPIPGGGMGVLYRARDRQLQRIVALKFLPAGLGRDPRAKERFLLEARAAAALDHRNVCTIHEIGESEGGELFIVMPFYDGETVLDVIARGPLPVSQAVSIAAQIARGLAHAHERGSIHRDIKPANVMLTPGGVVKILDFGIVKQDGIGLTRTGGAVGTLPYMSPERINRDAVDGRTDIWSLGVVLYEMLAGHRPFDGPDEQALREAIAFRQPPSLKAVRPAVPSELLRLLNDALAKHPDDRPASADAFAAALDALLLTDAAPAEALVDASASRDTDTGQVLPGGERRHTTVVVSGLSGYGELVERCAPDEVDQVIRRLKRDAWEIAERHGGTINEFSEERIVLLFGAPVSMEDHCVRAVRAAVELRALVTEWRHSRTAAQKLALHTAIDVGEAAVQRITGALSPYRIAGQPVRRATQLCAHARTNEILLSPQAQRTVSSQFHTTPSSRVRLPDDPDPFTPVNVVAERAAPDRLDQMADASNLTAFTGRGAELAALTLAFEDARGGRGRFVTVTGEAGIGKSRLLLEFRRTLDPTTAAVLVGRCSSYGQATAFVPFLQAMQQLLVLEPGATAWTDTDAADRITALGPGLERFLPYYLRLLSIPSETHRVSPERDGQMRLVISEALVALLLAAAASRPLVLLLEDWHWADPASEETLRRLIDLLDEHRLLVVTTTRVTVPAEWQRLDEHRPVTLRAFEPAHTTAMLRALLDAHDVPGELAARLHERTGGNPFFLEETVRSLIEAGTIRPVAGQMTIAGSLETLQIPATVQAVIRMRLDRLDLETRQVVRVAAVVGRDFSRAMLLRLLAQPDRVTRAIATLLDAGIIRQTAALPEPAYSFRHTLTQETAYAGLLEHQRADLHGQVGEAIEALHASRLSDHFERLAQHFSLAEKWPKAVAYGLASADRMRDLMQVREALHLLDRTREWAALLDNVQREATIVDILFRQVRLCDRVGIRARQRQLVEQLVTMLEPAGDDGRLAEAYLRRGELHAVLHEFDEAEAWLERSLSLYRTRRDPLGERASLRALGFLRWTQERYEEALAFGEAALQIDRQQNLIGAMAGELHNLASVHTILGRTERARACLEEALEVSDPARDHNPAFPDLWEPRLGVLHTYGCLLARQGELDRALAYLGPDAEWSRDADPLHVAHFSSAVAHVYLQRGEINECLAAYGTAIEASRRADLAPELAQALEPLGETLLALGRHREAIEPLQEAARVFARVNDPRAEARTWARVAQLHERLGNVADAQSSWERTLALQKEVANPTGEVEALEGQGRVARRHLPASVALRFYEAAIARSRTTAGDQRTTARLHNSAGVIEWTRGHHAGALRHFELALALFQALGDDAGSGQMMNSVGVSLSALGRCDEARNQLERAVAHHARSGQTLLEGHALAALGDLSWETGDSSDAARLYEQSLLKRQEVGDTRGQGWMLQRLARARAAIGLHGEADALLSQAAELAVVSSDEELMNACAQLGASGRDRHSAP